MDDDCDGLVDEVSVGNGSCGTCFLEQFAGHAFWFCDFDRTWEEAREDCLSRGADLVAIPDEATNAYLTQHLGGGAGLGTEFWIGANDLDTEGVFQWADGTPWAHENWSPNEPNNTDANEHCAQLGSTPEGQWSDMPCDLTAALACWTEHVP